MLKTEVEGNFGSTVRETNVSGSEGDMDQDHDHDLLTRVVGAIDKEDFFRATIFNDTFKDWELARELGEFLVRIEPDSELMGHALLLRAYRHLGNRILARHELQECQTRIQKRALKSWETTMLLPLLQEEERFLSE